MAQHAASICIFRRIKCKLHGAETSFLRVVECLSVLSKFLPCNLSTQRSARTAKMGIRKKRKQVEQEKDRKKRMSPLQDETRERSNKGTRKRRQGATAGSTNSSTGRSDQQQRQHRLRPRPPDYPPPLSLATSSLKRSPPPGKRKK